MFYIFLQFYLTSLRGKDYFAKEPEPVGAGCFWPLGAGAARKKYPESEPLGKKIRSRSQLKKKSGAGAAKKLASSPALCELYKKLVCKLNHKKQYERHKKRLRPFSIKVGGGRVSGERGQY